MTEDILKELCGNNGIDWAEGDHNGIKGFYLRWIESKEPEDKPDIHVSLDELKNLSWDQIYKSVINGRDVFHVTRIVGYFSKTKNWNKSKIGELKDRRVGNYSVSK